MMEPPPRPPRDELLHLLRTRGAMTLDALMAALGLSKTATRAHALRLEREGLIERSAAPSAGPGRPPVRFELTEAGANTFPRHEPELFGRLLAFLLERGERDTVRAFFETVWRQRRARFEQALEAEGPGARLEALERVLAEDGFMPRLRTEAPAGGPRLVVVRECNCPLPAALRATRIPCELEGRFLADAVGGELESASLASSRADTCEFRFRAREA